MEKRIANLEDFAGKSGERFDRVETRLDRIETRLDGIDVRLDGIGVRLDGIEVRMDRVEVRLDHTATKEDVSELRAEMHKGFSDMIKWVVGTAIALGATGITVMTFVLNYGAPRLPAATAVPQPIIIHLPAPTAAAPAILPR